MKKILLIFLLLSSFAGYAQLQLPYSIKNVNPVPVDYYYGPWANVAAAKAGVPLAVRYGGLTVMITGSGLYQWLATDLTDAGLLPLQTITTQTMNNDAVVTGNNKYIQFGTTGSPLYSLTFNSSNSTLFQSPNDITPLSLYPKVSANSSVSRGLYIQGVTPGTPSNGSGVDFQIVHQNSAGLTRTIGLPEYKWLSTTNGAGYSGYTLNLLNNDVTGPSFDINTQLNNRARFYGPLRLQDYATGSLPTASNHPYSLAYDTSTGTVKYSNGSAWADIDAGGGGGGSGTVSPGTAGEIAVYTGSTTVDGTTALPNGTTATTQSPGNNSTKVATTAYVEAAVAAGGGGGTPGGSNTQMQFNDSGSFGGDADLTYNKTTNLVDLTGTMNIGRGTNSDPRVNIFTEDRSGLAVGTNAGLRVYPASGTNVAASLGIFPKGTGSSSTYKTAFAISNTDFLANSTNYEFFIIAANGSLGYNIISEKGGTGSYRPIIIDAANVIDHTNPTQAKQIVADVTGYVGINKTGPGFNLDIEGDAANVLRIKNTQVAGPFAGSAFVLQGATPTAADHRLGVIVFGATNGTANTNSAYIQGLSSQSHSVGSAEGSYINFLTTPTGTATATEKFRIGPEGQLGLSGANYGTSGYVLTSQGSSSPPIWSPAGGGWQVTGTTTFTGNMSLDGDYNLNIGVITPVNQFLLLSENAVSLTSGTTMGFSSGDDINLAADNSVVLSSSIDDVVVSHGTGSFKINGLVESVLLSGTSLTLDDDDHRGKVIYCTSSSAVTITVPSGLPLGFNCTIIQDHATGTVTLSASGTTIKGKTATTGDGDSITLDHYKASEAYIGF